MGMLSPAAVLVVVHMDRGEKTRLIAVPKANRRERQVFYDYLATRNSACLRPKRVCICAWIMKASPPPIPFDPQSLVVLHFLSAASLDNPDSIGFRGS